MPPLLPYERAGRVAGVAVLLLCGALFGRWAPQFSAIAPKCIFHTVTGLPCAFCGATRSVCAAAGGDWGRALEMNPVGIGALVVLMIAAVVAGVEAVRGRALADWGVFLRRGARFLAVAGVMLAAWWAVHLLGAVRKPNTELVDFTNPIARRVAGWLGGASGGERGAEGD